MASPSDVLAMIDDGGLEFVDLRFCDLPGQIQHFTIPVSEIDEDSFEDGFGFDGSSIRGFQEIQESDMLLVPDPNTAVRDPFMEIPTLILYCFVRDPVTGQAYDKDPRYIAKKAEAYLVESGVAEVSYWGPEAEFYIFDSARFEQKQNSAFYEVDSIEGAWNSGREEPGGNLAYKPRYKEGYFPVPPTDHFQDMRSEMARVLIDAGIHVEVHHHEVGTAGQAEIDIRYDTLLRTADSVTLFKYIVKNVAWKHGKTVTFMPKPIFQDNGSGMHTHQRLVARRCSVVLRRGGVRRAIGYGPPLLGRDPASRRCHPGVCCADDELVPKAGPGYEAPVNLVYSQRNRSAAIRVPVYSRKPALKRIEFRCPDPSANPYLAFAAMLMAGLDGIANQMDPGAPVDKDLYDLPPAELAQVPSVPGSLEESLDALEADHEFLLTGGVFTQELIEDWIAYKRVHEVDEMRFRPHPHEFNLYYDI